MAGIDIKQITPGITGEEAAKIIYENDAALAAVVNSVLVGDWAGVELLVQSLTTQKDIVYGGLLRSAGFTTGSGGQGAMIDQEGNAELQSLKVRDGIETSILVKNGVTLQGNEFWVSDYGVIMTATDDQTKAVITDNKNEPLLDGNGDPLLANLENTGSLLVNFASNGSHGHTFRADDILRIGVEHENGIASTEWYRVDEVYSATSVVVTPVTATSPLLPGMTMARQGNFTDQERQNSIYMSGRGAYLRFLVNVNSTEIGPDNIAFEITEHGIKFPVNSIDGSAIKDRSIAWEKMAEELEIPGNTISGAALKEGSVPGGKLSRNIEIPEGAIGTTKVPGTRDRTLATTEYTQIEKGAILSTVQTLLQDAAEHWAQVDLRGTILAQSSPNWISDVYINQSGVYEINLVPGTPINERAIFPVAVIRGGTVFDRHASPYDTKTGPNQIAVIITDSSGNTVQSYFNIRAKKS